MKEFKEIVVTLRKDRKYSQKQLADILEISKSTIAMWETGKRMPTPDMMEKIADHFNVDMDFIYGKTDIKRRGIFNESDFESIFSDESAHFTANYREALSKFSDYGTMLQDMCDLTPEQLKNISDMVKAYKLFNQQDQVD